jgi:hypothetical protein
MNPFALKSILNLVQDDVMVSVLNYLWTVFVVDLISFHHKYTTNIST